MNRLHQQRRGHAPPFARMRENAVDAASRPVAAATPALLPPRWQVWSAALAALLLLLLGWPRHETKNTTPADVDSLLVSIERELARHESLMAPNYPTDILLTLIETDLQHDTP